MTFKQKITHKYHNNKQTKMTIYIDKPSRLMKYPVQRMRPEELVAPKGSFTQEEIEDLSKVAYDIQRDRNPDKDLLMFRKKNKIIVERF